MAIVLLRIIQVTLALLQGKRLLYICLYDISGKLSLGKMLVYVIAGCDKNTFGCEVFASLCYYTLAASIHLHGYTASTRHTPPSNYKLNLSQTLTLTSVKLYLNLTLTLTLTFLSGNASMWRSTPNQSYTKTSTHNL